tara:strand:- start:919 stop:1197 length:279 start_codon:yes stop_codon:yes gene_type:complete
MAASDWFYSRSPFERLLKTVVCKKQTTNKVKELCCFLWHQDFGLLSCNEIITETVEPLKYIIKNQNTKLALQYEKIVNRSINQLLKIIFVEI